MAGWFGNVKMSKRKSFDFCVDLSHSPSSEFKDNLHSWCFVGNTHFRADLIEPMNVSVVCNCHHCQTKKVTSKSKMSWVASIFSCCVNALSDTSTCMLTHSCQNEHKWFSQSKMSRTQSSICGSHLTVMSCFCFSLWLGCLVSRLAGGWHLVVLCTQTTFLLFGCGCNSFGDHISFVSFCYCSIERPVLLSLLPVHYCWTMIEGYFCLDSLPWVSKRRADGVVKI